MTETSRVDVEGRAAKSHIAGQKEAPSKLGPCHIRGGSAAGHKAWQFLAISSNLVLP